MADEIKFFITDMPPTRLADYYLGYLDGSVFIDFNNYDSEHIQLTRISFDGYGCCDLKNKATPIDEVDSKIFKKMFKKELLNQSVLFEIIKRTISVNRELLWEDALKEYDLL